MAGCVQGRARFTTPSPAGTLTHTPPGSGSSIYPSSFFPPPDTLPYCLLLPLCVRVCGIVKERVSVWKTDDIFSDGFSLPCRHACPPRSSRQRLGRGAVERGTHYMLPQFRLGRRKPLVRSGSRQGWMRRGLGGLINVKCWGEQAEQHVTCVPRCNASRRADDRLLHTLVHLHSETPPTAATVTFNEAHTRVTINIHSITRSSCTRETTNMKPLYPSRQVPNIQRRASGPS